MMRIRGLTDHTKLNLDASSNKNKGSNRVNSKLALVNNVNADKCLNCSGNHRLIHCDDFKNKSVKQRTQFLKSHKCCFNCLKVGHFPTNCTSKNRCSHCKRAHHTLIHRDANLLAKSSSENSFVENKCNNSQPSISAAKTKKKSRCRFLCLNHFFISYFE